nr:MAG TPA: hypothetical protein [Caudoviricetes sp.]
MPYKISLALQSLCLKYLFLMAPALTPISADHSLKVKDLPLYSIRT